MKTTSVVIYGIGFIILVCYIFFKSYLPTFIVENMTTIILLSLIAIVLYEIIRKIKR